MNSFELADLRHSPNALATHYSRFRVAQRLLLTGHSHQAWPDIALTGQIDAFEDAARDVDAKWTRAAEMAEAVRTGFRRMLGGPTAELALGANTHELVIRFLSALDLSKRPRLVTSDGEFHTLRRQLDRLAEAGVRVCRVPTEPADTLAQRLVDAMDADTAAVLVSSVLFETARIVPGLDALAGACRREDVELLVDAYHALGVVPMSVMEDGLESAWIVGGGYKYLQLGEGNCFLRLPEQANSMRPVVTGWFTEFADLAAEHAGHQVGYATGGARFAGATYDPTSHYRAARVFDFFDQYGLTPAFLRRVSLHQNELLTTAFDNLDAPEDLITRDRSHPRDAYGGFLALRSRYAAQLSRMLAERGVSTDSRGEHLRFGPAPYLADAQLETAIAALGDAVNQLSRQAV